jgi:hypothetical protein
MFISGNNKFDVALAPSTLNTAVTSSYLDLAKYEKVIFIASAGSMGSTDDFQLSILQAKSSTGSGTVALGVYSTMNGTPAATGQITKANVVTVLGTTGTLGAHNGTVVLNGLTFTFKTSSDAAVNAAGTTATFNANRYICEPCTQGGEATYTALHHLAAYVNHATYGCPGIIATVGSATTNIAFECNKSHGSVDKAVTIVCSEGATCAYINSIIGSVECHSAELATSSGFNYVACQSSAKAVTKFSLTAIRSGARYSPETTNLMAYDFGV